MLQISLLALFYFLEEKKLGSHRLGFLITNRRFLILY
uniref:Uncharacterized protein n=1 Tax=Arundo donax TaxID=35708 RepID=A0A0A9AH79_ARUDO